MHVFIFWGFTILGVQVIHMFVRGFVDEFTLPGLSVHLLGGPYLFIKDVMEVVVVGAIAVALYRWLVSHPARLYGYAPAENRLRGQSHGEAILILAFMGAAVTAHEGGEHH